MRRALRVVAVLSFLGLVGGAAATAGAQQPGRRIMELRLSGVVDPFVASYVKDGIAGANDDGDLAVLLTIDTPGGLDSAMRDIVRAILSSRVPVICYTAPSGARAASAGTFVMMSCPVAAMAPGTNIGAAHPVGISGAIELEKAENDAAAFIRSLAESRGRNAEWAESSVRESVSASAEEAVELDVIDLIAPSIPALLHALDGRHVEVAGGRTVTLHTTGVVLERLRMGAGAVVLHTLLSPNLAFIFFYLGLALIVAEFFVPGGVVGTLGAILLVLAIVALGMLPVQLLGVVLLVASVAFFLLELKLPGTGLATGAGIATLVLGALFLFDPAVPSARVSPGVIAPVAIAAGAFFMFVLRAAIRMRKQRPVSAPGPAVGSEGVVVRDLDPAGVVLVAAEEWSAESQSGPIPKGASIRVVEVSGLRLKVVPAGGAAQSPTAPPRRSSGDQAAVGRGPAEGERG